MAIRKFTGERVQSDAPSSDVRPAKRARSVGRTWMGPSEQMGMAVVAAGFKNLGNRCIDPITLELPVDPVYAEDGQIYERDSIQEWFARFEGPVARSPAVFNKEISKNLIPASLMQELFERFIPDGIWNCERAKTWLTMHIKRAEADVATKQAQVAELWELDYDEAKINEAIAAFERAREEVKRLREKEKSPPTTNQARTCGPEERIGMAAVAARFEALSDSYICPITRELPMHPVYAADGQIYEREYIQKWFARFGGSVARSPITNENISKKLTPASLIQELFELFIPDGIWKCERAKTWLTKRARA